MILGEEIPEEGFPMLLELAKTDPDTLERTLLSMSKKYAAKVQKKALGALRWYSSLAESYQFPTAPLKTTPSPESGNI